LRTKLNPISILLQLRGLNPANHHNLCQNNDKDFEVLADSSLYSNIAAIRTTAARREVFISAQY